MNVHDGSLYAPAFGLHHVLDLALYNVPGTNPFFFLVNVPYVTTTPPILIEKKNLIKHKIKKPLHNVQRFFYYNWRLLTLPDFTLVPSAQLGLTSLFEMGRGDHQRNSHHKFYYDILV